MTERQRVDVSPTTALATCSCGWRELSLSRFRAWSLAASHAANAHPEDGNYNAAWNAARRKRKGEQ